VVTIPYVEAVTSLLSPVLDARLRLRLVYRGIALFDRLAAGPATKCHPRIVVGFENGCLQLFHSAKRIDALCVLDAASVHHAAQPVRADGTDTAFWQRVNARKDEEIALANHIVVLSEYARETYVAAGVSPAKISIVPPGVWTAPQPRETTFRTAGSGIRFLFVGNVKFAKGIDLLLAAFSRLELQGKRLAIAGAAAEPQFLPDPLPEGVEYLGRLGREALSAAYAESDMLVMPSRADGFGFVVPEAMSAGLPVIVSSATGAKDLVQQGANGWIVPVGSEPALHDAMAAAAGQRHRLGEMGMRGKEAVRALTWDAYSERIRLLYRRLLEPGAR
jgi:glycosyltransferase involved in cell wall biosynthesis